MPIGLKVVGLIRIVRYQPDHRPRVIRQFGFMLGDAVGQGVLGDVDFRFNLKLSVISGRSLRSHALCTQDSGREGLYSHQPRSPS